MANSVGTAGLPASADAQNTAAVVLAAEDVDAAARLLHSRGVTFVAEPQDRTEWGMRTAHFRDPDGYLIEINQGL